MYKVKKSPWPSRIPNGATLLPSDKKNAPNAVNPGGKWFTLADGSNPFSDDATEDGTFKLFEGEYEHIKIETT